MCTIAEDCAQIAESGLKPPFESPPFAHPPVALNVVGRTPNRAQRGQISSQERKCKYAKERKRPQRGAKEHFCAKMANDQVCETTRSLLGTLRI